MSTPAEAVADWSEDGVDPRSTRSSERRHRPHSSATPSCNFCLRILCAPLAALTPPAALATRFALVFALAIALVTPLAATDDCATLRQKAAPAVPRAAHVALVWHGNGTRAAAALLRAALLAVGYEPARVRLVTSPAAADLCRLLRAVRDRDRFLAPTEWEPSEASEAVVIALSVAWWPRADLCGLSQAQLQVLAPGVVALAPRLHCAVPARTHPATALRDCGLEPPRSGTDADGNVNVLVVAGQGNVSAKLAARLTRGGAALRTQAVERAELAQRVAAPREPLLFLDAELWADAAHVLPAEPPPPAPVPLLLVDEARLISRAPALFLLLNGTSVNRSLDGTEPFRLLNGTDTEFRFAPTAALLRAVLDEPDAEQAACRLVPTTADYDAWLHAADQYGVRRAVAVLCRDSNFYMEYRSVVQELVAKYVSQNATRLQAQRAGLQMTGIVVDCKDAASLQSEILRWSYTGMLGRTVAVVAPAEVAAAAAPYAVREQLPLLTYSAGVAGVRSTAGSAEHLASALRRLLRSCGWRRVALLTERGSVAAEAAARALAGDALLVRQQNGASAAEPLEVLLALDARVLVVLGGARWTGEALRAAHALGLTPARGFVWIVSAYPTHQEVADVATDAATDAAAGALEPLALSFRWSGAGAARGGLHAELEERVGSRPWPTHYAALADALITVGVGFERLLDRHNDTIDNPNAKKKLKYFWEGLRSANISGVVDELLYDEDGSLRAPRVYLERWSGGQRRPQLLDSWREQPRAGDPVCPLPAPPPDGDPRCALRSGDPFRPRCHDAALAAALVALALLLLAAGGTWAAARRWLARRDRRLERDTTVRVLARREAAFAELAPHAVERAALRLGEELGAGRFGRVRLAELRRRRRPAVVAVKALRDGASPTEEGQFLREARTLAALRHERVVRFEGVCWEGGPPLLLMEYAAFGDLLRYLRARRHLAGGTEPEAAQVSAEALTRLAREAAEALAYLAARDLVHRDVRAANCLVDARHSLKLADFGLARETAATDGEYLCRGRALFPVLWMAPESLERGVATAAADAWSFGVLALELVTLGARPFGAAAPAAAVRAVLAGGRPPLPRAASAETRALVLACWRRAPERRPAAARLVAWLAQRPLALRPALPPAALYADVDSGIGDEHDADTIASE